MKSIVIISITIVLLIVIPVLVLSSNDSFASPVLFAVSYSFGVVIVFTIPLLIILYVLKNKGKIESSVVKNILKGIGLLFLGLIVVGITSASFTHDDVNIKSEKVNEQRQENLTPKSIALSETQYENMVLNYKGKDGKGFSIKDFSDARCGDDQESFAQYLGDNFDGKSDYHHVMVHSPVNIDWNPPCLGAGWHFGVNDQGNVIAWDTSAERQDILDYLDNQG